jgi:hypothetical protein
MMLNHRFMLITGFVILSVAVPLGSASAQSSTRSSTATKHHHAIHVRHALYNRYNARVAPVAPVVPVVNPVSPGCYLPSDGCLSEYSVQN